MARHRANLLLGNHKIWRMQHNFLWLSFYECASNCTCQVCLMSLPDTLTLQLCILKIFMLIFSYIMYLIWIMYMYMFLIMYMYVFWVMYMYVFWVQIHVNVQLVLLWTNFLKNSYLGMNLNYCPTKIMPILLTDD